MNRLDNPFHDLWLTEILSPEEFVRMFSPDIVNYSGDLFGSGNVVVRGRQGSGKSMLLRLLDTKTRVAYARSSEASPIPSDRQFISASINLTRSNVSAMSSRLPPEPSREDKEWAASNFADFLNYSLALNLIKNIRYLAEQQSLYESTKAVLNIHLTEENKTEFVADITSNDCWYGALTDCNSLEEILSAFEMRLTGYRSYFNFNRKELDKNIIQTKTDIGQPIASLAEALRSSGIIPKQCSVYFKIDQHEELFELERETGLGDLFRQVINKALANRDRRLAYRIGTRHYSWSQQIKIWGTAAHLEEMRDYSTVDIDEIFRRKEDASIADNAFRGFAMDVFRRRLVAAGYTIPEDPDFNCIKGVLGTTPTSKVRAMTYSTPATSQRLKLPSEWDTSWKDLIINLRDIDPLEGKLGEAWLRQKAQMKSRIFQSPVEPDVLPWKNRRWWRKERNEVALMQLASETGQNLSWYGERHIIDLSGWNILAFMSICRTIWSGWLRRKTDKELNQIELPNIDIAIQVVGIFEASKMWIDKLREGQDGDKRREFVLKLGKWFSDELKSDKSISNPGHNGFSLQRTEFESNDSINLLIKKCRDYGDLIESTHTSKVKGEDRLKWYLNPILCPYFGLPHVRTKEPMYTNLDKLKSILNPGKKQAKTMESKTINLFGDA